VAVREELFYQRGTPPEATYLFKHALIRDAAYQSLLRTTRRRHHQRVSETLIDRMSEVVETQPELVAHHLTEAGDQEAAIEWWRRAGQRALERSANLEARRHFEQGIDLVAGLPDGAPKEQIELPLQVGLGWALWALTIMAMEAAERTWTRILELSERLEDNAARATALLGLSNMHQTRSELAESVRYAVELRELGASAGDLEAELAGWTNVIGGHFLLGNLDPARDAIDRFIRRDSKLETDSSWTRFGWSMRVVPRAWGSWALWLRGHCERALWFAEEGIALARRAGHPPSLCVSLGMYGGILVTARLAPQVRETSEELFALGLDQDAPLWTGVGRLLIAWAKAVQGEESHALAVESQDALTQAGSTSNLAAAPFMIGCHADTLRMTSSPADSLEWTDRALAVAAQIQQPFFSADLHRLKGELSLQMSDRTEDEAEGLFRRAIEIASSQEARSLELRAATSLARLWQRQGKKDDARALLAPVYEWFTEGFDTPDLRDARALLERLGG
jgi:tetratricopeptide (TPR) repeat protein